MSRHLSDDEIVEMLKATDTVPEPSPLFWEHAARRVRAAVDAEPPRRLPGSAGSRGREAAWSRRRLPRCSCCSRARRMCRPSAVAVSPAPAANEIGRLDEDSWMFVASLGGDLDVDAAARAGLLAPGEATDRAMQALDAEERAELATLLHRALEGPEI